MAADTFRQEKAAENMAAFFSMPLTSENLDFPSSDSAATCLSGETSELDRQDHEDIQASEDIRADTCEASYAGTNGDSEQNDVSSEDEPSNSEEVGGEFCHKCGVQLEPCRCYVCRECWEPWSHCKCDECARCSNRGTFCICPYCKFCKEKFGNCECKNCDLCNLKPHDCRCVHSNDTKVALSDHLIQNVHTSELFTRRRVWPDVEYETLVLSGQLKNSYVLVIRKPSVVFASLYGFVTRTVNEKLWHRLISIRDHPRIKPWYVSAALWLEPEVEATHINVKTVQGISKMVTELAKIQNDRRTPTVGFDCEGDNLGRHGTTCYIQIRDYTKHQTYLVDLLTLGQRAWETPGLDKVTTLRTIFESVDIIKIVFDVRGDSNALYNDYKIKLAGVLDVQYLALLRMPYPRTYRVSFVSTMTNILSSDSKELQQWKKLKNYDFEGDYSVFKERPLPKALKLYAINDVYGVDKLAAKLTESLTHRGLDLAFEWTQKEIEWTWEEIYENKRQYTPDGFSTCWYENINKYTDERLEVWESNSLDENTSSNSTSTPAEYASG